jgi:hypothetical protein
MENYLQGNHFIKQSHVPLTIPSSVFANVDTSYSTINQIYTIAAPSNSILPLNSFLSSPTTLFVLPTTNNPIQLIDNGITVTIVSNGTASFINGNLFVLGSTRTVGSYTIQMVANGSTAILITPFTPAILSDICFIKNTLVQTDQGKFPIQTLTKKHTIHKKSILHVTKTIHCEPYLVKVCAYAFGTFPTQDTYMSMKHKIYLDSPMQAKNLVNEDTILLVPYDGEPLYNVLLETHSIMKVHGMAVETMDPNCLVALFYKSKLSPKQKDAMIVTINKDPTNAMTYLKRYQ